MLPWSTWAQQPKCSTHNDLPVAAADLSYVSTWTEHCPEKWKNSLWEKVKNIIKSDRPGHLVTSKKWGLIPSYPVHSSKDSSQQQHQERHHFFSDISSFLPASLGKYLTMKCLSEPLCNSSYIFCSYVWWLGFFSKKRKIFGNEMSIRTIMEQLLYFLLLCVVTRFFFQKKENIWQWNVHQNHYATAPIYSAVMCDDYVFFQKKNYSTHSHTTFQGWPFWGMCRVHHKSIEYLLGWLPIWLVG